jgi:hypothetical protein
MTSLIIIYQVPFMFFDLALDVRRGLRMGISSAMYPPSILSPGIYNLIEEAQNIQERE